MFDVGLSRSRCNTILYLCVALASCIFSPRVTRCPLPFRWA